MNELMYPEVQNIINILNKVKNGEYKEVGKFNMDCIDFEHSQKLKCDTACCIGGWCQHLNNYQFFDIVEAVSEVGAMCLDDAKKICYPSGSRPYKDKAILEDYPYDDVLRFGYRNITIDMAIECLKHFMKTGVVDWPRAIWGE